MAKFFIPLISAALMTCTTFKKFVTGERSHADAMETSQRQPVIFRDQVLFQGQKTGTVLTFVISQLTFDNSAWSKVEKQRDQILNLAKEIIRQKKPGIWETGTITLPSCGMGGGPKEITQMDSGLHVISDATGTPVVTTFLLSKIRGGSCEKAAGGGKTLHESKDFELHVYDHLTGQLTTDRTSSSSLLSVRILDLHTPTEKCLILHPELFRNTAQAK